MVRLASQGSKLALDNVIICPKQDFHFVEGQLYIHNDVVFTGTHRFVYNSSQESVIASQGTLTFEPRTTFFYDTVSSYTTDVNLPASTPIKPLQNELLIMADENANLFCDQCTVQVSHSGLRLTKGSVFFDNFV